MPRYPGGCAIMLKTSDPEGRLFEAASRWLPGPMWTPVLPDNYHLTLQFVGRDLDGDKIGAAIYSAFLFARDPFPAPIEFTGTLGMLTTRKGRYMVAHVKPDALEAPRKKLQDILSEMGVVARDTFDFAPHVTLAEAPSTAPKAKPPEAVKPFLVPVTQMVVKYGPNRMVIDL